MTKKGSAAILLAGGFGTRMRTSMPKLLLPALGKPILGRLIDEALKVFEHIFVVLPKKEPRFEGLYDLVETYSEKGVSIAVQEVMNGTAGAVMAAIPHLSADTERVAIINGDLPALRSEFLTKLSEAPENILTVQKRSNPVGYGRVFVDSNGKANQIIEQYQLSDEQKTNELTNLGLYYVSKGLLVDFLESARPNPVKNEILLTDLVSFAYEKPGEEIRLIEIPEDDFSLSGVNTLAELSDLLRKWQLKMAEDFMDQGVFFESPDNVYLDPDAEIGADSYIASGVRLEGQTKVGSGCILGQGCVIIDSLIGDGSEIKPYSSIESARVAKSCKIGPFARIRPGAKLDDQVQIGNFVEVKKSHLKEGVKANHLSYLGDALIGSGTNIGAGTITCNYDGKLKHQTVIGEKSFIGSDTQLVAPVKVGSNAYVGAGTTVTKDVPDFSLAISRVQQHNIEGYVKRRNQES